jgi:hypothetical protein
VSGAAIARHADDRTISQTLQATQQQLFRLTAIEDALLGLDRVGDAV